MKKRLKNNRGITLIALVVTIIILLILAGITITMILGQDGIFNKAETARVESRGANVQEARDLWKLEQKTDEYTDNKTAKSLEELIDDLVSQKLLTEDEKDIILGNEEKGIEATGQITIGSRTIVFKEKSILDFLYIGDYVNYEPQKEKTTCTIQGKYNGKEDKEYAQQNVKWRIFDIDDDMQQIYLISEKPVNDVFVLQDARGYNNGVYLLNYLCETLYSNPSKQAVARSIQIEDIQKMMKVVDGKKVYETYVGDTGIGYGQTFAYNTNTYKPLQWELNDRESDSKNLIEGENLYDGAIQAESPLIVQQTHWKFPAEVMSQSFEKVATRENENDADFYYQLFCNTGERYWIASRFTYIQNEERAYFGIRDMFEDTVAGGRTMYTSDNKAYNFSDSHHVRPIVRIPFAILDIETGYIEEQNGWQLKETL